jgi:hypothetical protein
MATAAAWVLAAPRDFGVPLRKHPEVVSSGAASPLVSRVR